MSYLGIRGFESVLRGGIPERAEVLLLAPEGPERYLIAAHYILEGLERGERVLLVLSGEAPDAFLARLGRMGVDVPAAQAQGSLVLVDWHTCWTRSVEGVEEDHRILRASRRVEDLVAAIERAVPFLRTARERRAFVDILPLALKALDEVQAVEAIASVREAVSAEGLRALYAADRTMPEGRIDTLLQSFHAVLDARGEEGRDRIAIAVLAVGGVKLTPHHRRARLREDGAAVEPEASARTFSCPICDARVPFSAPRCPSCGTLRSDMAPGRGQPGLTDYLESLGRPAGADRGRVSPPPEKPEGLTNGVRPAGRSPGRVNGTPPGRVNGIAPGRVNGIAPAGRTNGLVNGTRGRTNGVTNGLVNGIRRARGGVTNGLTNGSGFTNGLGGRRARGEARRSRWKAYLVPLLAAGLLLSPMFFADTAPSPRFAIDGSFGDWAGIPGFAQTPPTDANASVALTGYKVQIDGSQLYLYATVSGSWFADPDRLHVLYAFIDPDGNASTGYRAAGVGAQYVASIEGSGGAVTGAYFREFSGSDPYNWSAWRTGGSVSAVAVGDALEASIPWADGAAVKPAVLLLADDGYTRSFSGVAFGPGPGALRATVRSRANVVSHGTPDVVAVDLEAFGAPVNVTRLTVESDGTPAMPPRTLPITVEPSQPRTVTVPLDTSALADETLLTVTVTRVVADAPVLLVGGPVRAYVGSEPAGLRIDGLFDDWANATVRSDPVDSPDADRDLRNYAANETAGQLSLYADVRGTIFAGSAAPVRRLKPQGGAPPAAPGAPSRVVGEDVLRVYVDLDRNSSAGAAIPELPGADLLLEARGILGRIVDRRAYTWDGGWTARPAPLAENDASRFEASLPIPAAGVLGIVFQTLGWHGPADSTDVAGTRGVHIGPDGVYRSGGGFTVGFAPTGRVDLWAGTGSLAWRLPSPPNDATWSLAPTAAGARYVAPTAEVRYSVSNSQLKEEFVFLERADWPSIAFPFALGGDAMVSEEVGEPLGIETAAGRTFEFAAPFARDAAGLVTPLELTVDVPNRILEIGIPIELRTSAAYPLLIDPVVNYTLRNDGAGYKKGEHLGYSVAVGDFNGDGYSDVLAGAPDNNLGGTPHGYAYIYLGPFANDRTTPDVTINGTTANAQFGFSVTAGNFNNDGYWDAVVSRRSNSALGTTGNISIYYGSASFDTTVDVQVTPPSGAANFGYWVAAGNVDNAYYDDLAVGEEGRNNGGGADGVAYLYKTPFSSVVSTANFTLVPNTNVSGHFGRSIAVGKIDSDAYADIVVGEPVFSGNSGRVHLFKGSLFTGSSGTRGPSATISAPSGGGSTVQFGASVSIGKMNGDAYADLLAGAPLFGSGDDGRAYVFLANSDGSGLTAGASPSATLAGQVGGEWFGNSVLAADLDDDGGGDAVVGAPGPATNSITGRAYWFDAPTSDQTVDVVLPGSQNNERFGFSVASGKFSNDPRTLLAVGGYLWDKNSGNPSDNDGRAVVATVPEATFVLLAGIAGALPLVRIARRRRRYP